MGDDPRRHHHHHHGDNDLSSEDLAEVEEIIGYTFVNPDGLRQAMLHASARSAENEGNERLEFLGDAVLGLVISQYLFDRYPELPEGELTQRRAAVVSRAAIGSRLKAMGLSEFILLGRGMAKRGKRLPDSVAANVYEAIVAAIWQDGGYEEAKAFCLRSLKPDLKAAAVKGATENHKSLLQQLAQRTLDALPRYETLRTSGPDHGKSFKVVAVIGRRKFDPAWGKSKKEAEQLAAANAIDELYDEHPNDPVFENRLPPEEWSSEDGTDEDQRR